MKKIVIILLGVAVLGLSGYFIYEHFSDKSSGGNHDLVYEISYSGINCLTPTLYLYDDNTYEYYDTFAVGDNKPTPKTGEYKFDMNSLLKDSVDDFEFIAGIYTIKDVKNNKSSYIDLSNEKMNDLLEQTKASLVKCLEQEGIGE